jgi:very-short-patch-repair endonuclease
MNYNKKLISNARHLRKEMTQAEKRLWNRIRNNQLGAKFRRQTPFDSYILDFFCVDKKLAIEIDGGQHYEPEGKEKDAARDEYLKNQGVTVLRFSNIDVLTNVDGVAEKIMEIMSECRPLPSPPLKGEEENLPLSGGDKEGVFDK